MDKPIETRIVRRNLSELKLLEKNARFMTATQFGQLVDNIRKDGKLTSLPLIYLDEVLSGNHRTKAAIKAGIEETDCIEITSDLTEEQKTAIVLSHNAISGQDDLSILKELYESLGMDAKAYSGLTDDAFKLSEIDVAGLSIGAPKYEELMILFLPEERLVFTDALDKLSKVAKQRTLLAARYDDFDAIFTAVTEVKKQLSIHNTAIALRVMTELAMAQLASMQQGVKDSEQKGTERGAK